MALPPSLATDLAPLYSLLNLTPIVTTDPIATDPPSPHPFPMESQFHLSPPTPQRPPRTNYSAPLHQLPLHLSSVHSPPPGLHRPHHLLHNFNISTLLSSTLQLSFNTPSCPPQPHPSYLLVLLLLHALNRCPSSTLVSLSPRPPHKGTIVNSPRPTTYLLPSTRFHLSTRPSCLCPHPNV
jgi:hypothetical protein